MSEDVLTGLAVKLVAVAVLVLATTIATQRLGAFAGAMIAALPISAGPAFFFIAFDHGSAFVARSALTALAVNAAMGPFLLTYAALAQRLGYLGSIVPALGVWLLCALALTRFDIGPLGALVTNLVLYALCLARVRRFLSSEIPRSPLGSPMAIGLRVVAVCCAIAVVVLSGHLLGPRAAGLAALMPVVWCSVAFVLHAHAGGIAAAAVLANGTGGMIGYALAFAALYLTAEPLGWPVALGLALAISAGWNLALAILRPHLRYYAPSAAAHAPP